MVRLFTTRMINKNNPFKPDRGHLHHLISDKIGYSYAIITILLFLLSILIMVYLSISNIFIYIYTLIIYSLLVYGHRKKNT